MTANILISLYSYSTTIRIFILFWRLIKVTLAIFKSCVSHKSARIFIPEPYSSSGLLFLVCLSFFRLDGCFWRQQAVELPSREAPGSTSTAASVIADETRLHFSRSGRSPLLGRSAKRWRDEKQTYNISSIFNWLAYSWVRIYFFFWARSPNIMDSIIFPKVLSSQTPAGLSPPDSSSILGSVGRQKLWIPSDTEQKH